MKNNFAADPNPEADELRDVIAELREAYMVLDKLCSQLEGGGIVPAHDVMPTVARTVPTLRHAVTVLNSVTISDEPPERDN